MMAGGAHLLSVKLDGFEKLGRMMATQLPRGRAAFMAAMYLYASRVVTTAMRKAPALTGFLRRSRYVQHPTEAGHAFALIVGFDAPYAAPVHDRVTPIHPTGQAFFLRLAIDEHAPEGAAYLARETLRLWKAGATASSVPQLHPTAPTGEAPPKRPYLNKKQRRKRAKAALKNRAALGMQGPLPQRWIENNTSRRSSGLWPKPKKPKP